MDASVREPAASSETLWQQPVLGPSESMTDGSVEPMPRAACGRRARFQGSRRRNTISDGFPGEGCFCSCRVAASWWQSSFSMRTCSCLSFRWQGRCPRVLSSNLHNLASHDRVGRCKQGKHWFQAYVSDETFGVRTLVSGQGAGRRVTAGVDQAWARQGHKGACPIKTVSAIGNNLSPTRLAKTLDWAYAKAVDGLPGIRTAQDLAQEYSGKKGNLVDDAKSLVRWQIAKAGTSGFVTGVGGLATMPVTMPANIASVSYVQLRMIAAIAHLGGHDIHDDQVQTLAYTCLTGNAAKDILKGTGIVIGTKLTTSAIQKIPGRVLIEVNKKVGFRLITKFGEKGAVNLGKMVPFVGGVIGGTLDSAATKVIGKTAIALFLGGHESPGGLSIIDA
jgi:hypothetical protein